MTLLFLLPHLSPGELRVLPLCDPSASFKKISRYLDEPGSPRMLADTKVSNEDVMWGNVLRQHKRCIQMPGGILNIPHCWPPKGLIKWLLKQDCWVCFLFLDTTFQRFFWPFVLMDRATHCGSFTSPAGHRAPSHQNVSSLSHDAQSLVSFPSLIYFLYFRCLFLDRLISNEKPWEARQYFCPQFTPKICKIMTSDDQMPLGLCNSPALWQSKLLPLWTMVYCLSNAGVKWENL